VDLKKEIEFITNYIELQKLRTHISELVTFEFKGNAGNLKIAPLIFIIFIENAFKHGLKGDIKNQFIHIHFNIIDSQIEFICENNIGHTNETINSDAIGLGLKNVKKRLDLMYEGNYRLDINTEGEKYQVHLKIKL
jgi:LytS/YehU family sensor histidine kinase